MTPTEAVDFVDIVIAAWPNTRTEDKTSDIWYEAGLNEVSWEDGGEAVKNLLKVKSFISLAEILTEVRHIRELRIAHRPINDPPAELVDDEAAYRALVKEATRRLGDGEGGAKLLTIGTGSQPTPEYDQARGIYRDPYRIAAKKVRCPWPACRADIGSSCTVAGRPMTTAPAHDARLVAAGLADWVEVDNVRRIVLRQADTP